MHMQLDLKILNISKTSVIAIKRFWSTLSRNQPAHNPREGVMQYGKKEKRKIKVF